ncbi:ferric reductase-like transmembrane domain-containing protein [Dinoroseobacter sp. PD6]|uniref:ferric reductase-like transmembrane domain-containing protein n=1 Tax=Dinoroseobacter sp. PD6 TaxID=3028384 RepID=UPI00237A88C6|nr:ferric reductase-like transmembrane domain-containing protein [Dinoroseobacter sp. PD6]MDD9715157.1 ferric reductase-like transmembrane domain-containing protein [Dinoroseobacter sp. PD6]
MRGLAAWAAVGLGIAVPVVLAAGSPLLAWREPVYIAAGFAGIFALGLMLLQPLLAAGLLPLVPRALGRRVHVWTGSALVALVLVHVGGLWITSPPDVVDALLLVSPTPFSAWGVVAMWAVFGAAGLAVLRRRMGPRVWRRAHTAAVVLAVIGTAVHAVQIEGVMEPVTRALLCAGVLGATGWAVWTLRAWAPRRRA